MDETMLELLTLIKDIAPEVWAILLKQVYAEVAIDVFWGLVLLAAPSILYHKIEWDGLETVGKLVVTLFTALGLIFITTAIAWAYNPEFYALRFLIQSMN